MKVAEVETRVLEIPLTRPYTIAFRTVSAIETTIVRLRADDGSIGYGAASPEPHVTGETAEACQAALATDRLEWLRGESIEHLPRLLRRMRTESGSTPAAVAAVDIALHDLFAKQLGVPLVEALGRAQQTLPTSITVGIQAVDEALEEVREYLGRGFRALKLKLGKELERDLDVVRQVRSIAGPEVTIRVDPNQGFSAADLVTFLRETAQLGVEFVEQPLAADAIAELRSLPSDVRDRVAADESLLSPADALHLVEPPRACGIFNIKLMKCGGVGAAGRIATVAEESGVELMWGCMDESAISIAAALHAALASPATRYLDLDGSFDLARDVVRGGFELRDGCLATLPEPGLGVTWTEG